MLTDMVAGLDPKEFIQLALLLIAVGSLSGFLAGVFGIGAILVPAYLLIVGWEVRDQPVERQ
jgi:uncharacterized membrane protein YfcA